MAVTYEPISTTTVSGTPTTITLSPPSTYTDLRLIIWHSTAFGDNLQVRINNDTGPNYYTQYMNSSSPGFLNGITYWEFNWGDAANSFYTIDFMNYSLSSGSYKGVQGRQSGISNYPGMTVGTCFNSSPITSILLRVGAGGTQTFPNGTIITLFGILAA